MNSYESKNEKGLELSKSKTESNSKNEELIAELTENFRVFPLYKRAIADRARIDRCSLSTNELLSRRWRQHQLAAATRQRAPAQLPRVEDYHFYNYHNRYKPSESIHTRTNNRYHLFSGPAVDKHGEVPIPIGNYEFRTTKKVVQKPKHTANERKR